MTSGGAAPGQSGGDRDRRSGVGAWDWARPIGIGLLLAAILVVLLAGLLNDLIPRSGIGIITGPPRPTPIPSVTTAPTVTETPTPVATDTGGGTGGGGTGGGTNNGGGSSGGGSNNGGGSNGGGGGGGKPTTTPPRPTGIPTPTRTGIPTPTITPPTPPPIVTGPDQCTVRYGPGYCYTRQALVATVFAGRLSLTDGLGGSALAGAASRVALRPGSSLSGPSIEGTLKPAVVSDQRGSDAGWTVTAHAEWVGERPDDVFVSVEPYCLPLRTDAAPGLHAGPVAQVLDEDVAMCTKDGQAGSGGSTSGQYVVGGRLIVSTWIGAPLPVDPVYITYFVR